MTDDMQLEDSWVGEPGSYRNPLDALRSLRSIISLLMVPNSNPTGQPPLIKPLKRIGNEDRVWIRNTKEIPWRWICGLDITVKDGKPLRGTGWLIGPGTVITAGHNVFRHQQGREVKKIEIFPGRNGEYKPFKSCVAEKFRYPAEWRARKDPIYDYGAIILPPGCRYGIKLGHFGYGRLPDDILRGVSAYLCGCDTGWGHTQLYHTRELTAFTPDSLEYTIDTDEGQSGSPLWWKRNGMYYVIGIHNTAMKYTNHATRINKTVFDNLKKWKEEGT